MRGRNGGGNNNNNNNNNRRGPNPLNRNYESNGPDVKIRGSAQQIAEKYAALARDAMSSGDRVMAENYLQHAEHYNRIIAAAQAQMPIQHQQQNRDEFDEDLDDEREELEGVGNAAEAPAPAVNHGAGPQPVIEGMPAEVTLNGENGNRESGRDGNRHHRDRRNGYQNGQRAERGPRKHGKPHREISHPDPVWTLFAEKMPARERQDPGQKAESRRQAGRLAPDAQCHEHPDGVERSQRDAVKNIDQRQGQ